MKNREAEPTFVNSSVDEPEPGGSVTQWIASIKAGDLVAAQPLWDRYFKKLVSLARTRFPTLAKAVSSGDEEDAALSALNAICTGLADGRFSDLSDRDELWRLLVAITARKSINKYKASERIKRGGGNNVTASDLDVSTPSGLDKFIGADPTPEFIVQMSEDCQVLLGLLTDDPELKLSDIAIWKLEGFTRKEIASKLQCSVRTVAMRLKLIRDKWESHL